MEQFRERYRGFQIPLDNIATSQCSLVKQLAAAGTRIKAHISQADALKSIKDIIEFTDEESNVSETSGEVIADELRSNAATVNRIKSKLTKVQEEFLDALVEGEEVCLDELEELSRTPRGKKAAAVAAADAANLLTGKFVNLTELIPPLPDKGSFEVESIKKSQYFFS